MSCKQRKLTKTNDLPVDAEHDVSDNKRMQMKEDRTEAIDKTLSLFQSAAIEHNRQEMTGLRMCLISSVERKVSYTDDSQITPHLLAFCS